MHVHRTARTRFFTTIGNEVLRDNRLSYCARGILSHLLSFPDGTRGDIRTLAERSAEGRERVAAALRELERFGYLRRQVTRTPQGRLYTEVHLFDTPDGWSKSEQAPPHAGFPGSGGQSIDPDGDQNSKEREEKPSLPPPTRTGPGGREQAAADGETGASADLLTRIARAEPKLVLGRGEALRLAPLVTKWRRRGATDLHIVNTLTAGLPASVFCPARLIETRLRNKMPAEPAAPPARPECEQCRAPVVAAGLCRACREPASAAPPSAPAEFVQRLTRGAALARAALRGATAGGAAAGGPLPAPA